MDFVYDLTIDPDADNNTHAFALAMIGNNKSVLEVGCATGYFTKVLAERGCKVIGMELDAGAAREAENWAERVIVGSVDDPEPWDQVDDESVEVITFGDVLEHLQDPLSVLRTARRKLKPTGFIVTSLPNVAHGDVRLSLLHGSFQYRELGLLDRTHLRFFTAESIRELLRDAGLTVVDTKRVIVPLFATELELKKEDFPASVIEEIRANPEYETYQFVMKSVIDDGTQAVAEMAERLRVETDRASVLEEQNRVLRQQVNEVVTALTAMEEQRAELGDLQAWRDHAETLDQRVKQLEHDLAAMTARADDQADTAHRLHLALRDSERQYDLIKNSASFRLTSPLRQLKRIFKNG